MQPNDREKFLRIVIGFAELKGKQLSTAALELYWRAMQDWTVEDFAGAATHLLKTCEFMPTPADFEKLRKSARMSAGEAWALVLDRVRHGSSRWEYGHPERNSQFKPPDDDLINAAVQAIGGYHVIAMHDEDKIHFLEKRFCDHYENIGESIRVRAALPGIAADARIGDLTKKLLA